MFFVHDGFAFDAEFNKLIEDSLSAEKELQNSIQKNVNTARLESANKMPDFKKIASATVKKSDPESVAVRSKMLKVRTKPTQNAQSVDLRHQSRVSQELQVSR